LQASSPYLYTLSRVLAIPSLTMFSRRGVANSVSTPLPTKVAPPSDVHAGLSVSSTPPVAPHPFVQALSDEKQEDAPVIVADSAVGAPRAARSKGRVLPRDGKLFSAIGQMQIWKVPTNNTILPIMQTYVHPNSPFTSSALSATFGGLAFMVSSLDQISSLTALFDQYRIIEIEVWIIPRTTNNTVTSNTGLLATVVDYDDDTVLGTLGAALDYTNVVVGTGIEGHYRRFKPHAAMAAYSGAFSAFANVESPWIDAASTGVRHYGLKSVWTATDIAYNSDILVRLHTEWRNVR